VSKDRGVNRHTCFSLDCCDKPPTEVRVALPLVLLRTLVSGSEPETRTVLRRMPRTGRSGHPYQTKAGENAIIDTYDIHTFRSG
jgi:hypothetical protein